MGICLRTWGGFQVEVVLVWLGVGSLPAAFSLGWCGGAFMEGIGCGVGGWLGGLGMIGDREMRRW